MGEVVRIHDYHLRRLEREASDVLGQVLPLAEFAKQGGPVVDGAVAMTNTPMGPMPMAGVGDPWAGCHCPDGVVGLPAAFPDWDVG